MKPLVRALFVLCFVMATVPALALPPERGGDNAAVRGYKDKFVRRNLKTGGAGSVRSKIAILGEKMDGKQHVIQFKLEGVRDTQSEPTANIFSIEYGIMPPSYATAEQLLREGKYAEAAEQFAATLAIADVAKMGYWIVPSCTYNAGLCDFEQGKHDSAAARFSDVIEKHPDSRFVAPALFYLAKSHAATGKLDDATKAATTLRTVGAAYGSEWQEKANLLEADLQYSSKNYSPAAGRYKEIVQILQPRVAAEPGLFQLYCEAYRRVGECYLLAKEPAKAKSHGAEMTNSAHPEIKAAGFLLNGDIALQEQNYREAASAYSVVRVLYSNIAALQNDAMAGLGRAYARMYQAEKGARNLPSDRTDPDKMQAQRFAGLLRAAGRSDVAAEIEALLN